MQFFKLVALSASLALAQAKIGFTTAPAGSVTAGSPVKLAWNGGTSAPVTITLKQGDPDNLVTVAIITGDASGNSFTWTPSSSLPNAQNYALEISQGTGFDMTNFSGEFALSGGSTSTSHSSGSATSVVTVTSANSTATVAHTVFATGTGGTASGTGISMARNTTFVHATSKTASVHHTGGLSAGTATKTATITSAVSATGSSATSSGMAGQVGAQVGTFGMALLAVAAFL